MTDQTEAAKQPAKRKISGSTSFAASLFVFLAGCSIAVGLAGLGLNRGFGVHVPFLAALFVVVGFLFFARQATMTVADTWHSSRVKAESVLIGAAMAAQVELQQHIQGHDDSDFTGLLDLLKAGDKTSSGPYL